MSLETAVTNAQEVGSEMTFNGLDSHDRVGDVQAALLSLQSVSLACVVSSTSRHDHSCQDL